ncbi:MAG: hypothetical protein Q8O89_06900 [Nanoarchaeota archaeon]|nr:hypothetical protein [Nanoarchaeota archaeon]
MKKSSKAKKSVKHVRHVKSSGVSADSSTERISGVRSESASGGVGYLKIVKDSFKFSFSLDKILITYAIMLPVIILFIWFASRLLSLGNSLPQLLNPTTPPSREIIMVVAGPFVLLIGFVIIAALLQMLVRIAIVENAEAYAKGDKKSIFESIKAVSGRYWPALGATAIVVLGTSIITSLLMKLPYVGEFLSNIASLLLALTFFVYLQILIILDAGVIDSLKESYTVFVKNPLEVISITLITIIVELLLVGVSLLVMLPLAWQTVSKFIFAAPETVIDLFFVVTALKENFAVLSAGLFLVLLVWSFMSIFGEAIRTFFYLRIRKL